MTREARNAVLKFAAWAIPVGAAGGGLSWWLRTLPVIGGSAQFAFLAAMVFYILQIVRDTRRMERERLEFERLRLECEQKQFEFFRAATDRAHVLADAVLQRMKEADPPQVVEIRPKDWLQ